MATRLRLSISMLALVLVSCLVTATDASALVRPLSPSQLHARAALVVVAHVKAIDPHWTGTAQAPGNESDMIMTRVRLAVLEVLKGRSAADLTIEVPGGHVGTTSVAVTDAPSFTPGETRVLFLDAAGRVIAWRNGSLIVRSGRLPAVGMSLPEFEGRMAALTGAPPQVLRPGMLRTVAMPTHSTADHALDDPILGGHVIKGSASHPRPRIAAITPASASAGTKTKVAITGTGFGDAKGALGAVQFTWKAATRITATQILSWSADRIVVRVPVATLPDPDSGQLALAAASSGPVWVTNRWGQTSPGRQFSVSFAYGQRRWSPPHCTYRVNANGIDHIPARAFVDAAATTWNGAGSLFRFVPEGDGTCTTTKWDMSDGHNDVFWSSTLLPAGVDSAIAVVTSQSKDGVFQNADLCFNDAIIDETGQRVPWGDGSGGSYDVQTAALHELGRIVGLLDLYGDGDSAKTMYGRRSGDTVDRSLSSADTSGIRWIYGTGSGRIAFEHAGDIWSMKGDGSGKRNLTGTTKLRERAPSWSPDHARLAYIVDKGTAGDSCAVRTMRADGSHQAAVLLDMSSQGQWQSVPVTDVAWSPDGKALLLCHGPGAVADHSRLALVDWATKHVTELYDPGFGELSDPLWSADGRRVTVTHTFSASVPPHAICVDVASGTPTAFPTFWVPDPSLGYSTETVSWAPEGRRIAYVTKSDKHLLPDFEVRASLVVMSTDGSSPVQLDRCSSAQRQLGTLAWSCDGHDIVYEVSKTSGTHDLYVVDVTTGKSKRIATTATNPSWFQ